VPSRASRQGYYAPTALAAPALLIVAGTIAYPLGLELELWFSLSDAQAGQPGHFVGLANYAYLLRQPTYHDALLNTLVYVHPGEVVGLHGASLLV